MPKTDASTIDLQQGYYGYTITHLFQKNGVPVTADKNWHAKKITNSENKTTDVFAENTSRFDYVRDPNNQFFAKQLLSYLDHTDNEHPANANLRIVTPLFVGPKDGSDKHWTVLCIDAKNSDSKEFKAQAEKIQGMMKKYEGNYEDMIKDANILKELKKLYPDTKAIYADSLNDQKAPQHASGKELEEALNQTYPKAGVSRQVPLEQTRENNCGSICHYNASKFLKNGELKNVESNLLNQMSDPNNQQIVVDIAKLRADQNEKILQKQVDLMDAVVLQAQLERNPSKIEAHISKPNQVGSFYNSIPKEVTVEKYLLSKELQQTYSSRGWQLYSQADGVTVKTNNGLFLVHGNKATCMSENLTDKQKEELYKEMAQSLKDRGFDTVIVKPRDEKSEILWQKVCKDLDLKYQSSAEKKMENKVAPPSPAPVKQAAPSDSEKKQEQTLKK